MKPLPLVLALILILCAAAVAGTVAWTHPDMTSRRLWLDYPWTFGCCGAVALCGMLLLHWSSGRKK